MNKTVVLIFSYKRPLQLDACLKSLRELCSDYKDTDVNVLYRVDDERFDNTYKKVANENKGVIFFRETDFRKNVLEIIGNYKYIMFLTDDNIFVEKFRTIDGTRLLDEHNVLGFSLRLGLNTHYSYPTAKEQVIPPHKVINKKILLWSWVNEELDFGYPIELSSSVYRIEDIYPILDNCNYHNPNELEYVMDFCKKYFQVTHPYMACYEKSVAFCAPVNRVNPNNGNRSGSKEEYSIENLLTKYENGVRIDVNKLVGFIPNACHQEIDFDFYNT